MRAQIILAAADGWSNSDIADDFEVSRPTVGKWRQRFLQAGLDGLVDAPRPGAPRSISDEDVDRVIAKTLEETPRGATHWSTRSMAAATGLSQSTVARIWRAFSLQPHRVETFKLSNDPLFVSKVRDIVGLYLDPPDKALVLCVDEKSQIQALERTQPLLPLRPAFQNDARMTTSGTGRQRSSRLSTPRPVTSSDAASGGTGQLSSSGSCA
jgi:transposase